jgi:hypothetical protein
MPETIMAENIEQLVEDFRTNKLSRREFLHNALVLSGSLAAATMLADAIAPAMSRANLVDPNDPALSSGEIKYGSSPERVGKNGVKSGVATRENCLFQWSENLS